MCFRCVGANILLLTQAFRRKFIIPDFEAFASNINQLYYSTQRQVGGHVSSVFKPWVRGPVHCGWSANVGRCFWGDFLQCK